MIGVASTAPGYSLAASLGFIAAVGGSASRRPAVMLVAFFPMLFIASAYYYLNQRRSRLRHDVLLGHAALGPWIGWIGGWGIIIADIIVMANLSEIAGIYTFELFGYTSYGKWETLAVGVALDRAHDLDLLHRHRGLGAHPVGPARRRDRDAR